MVRLLNRTGRNALAGEGAGATTAGATRDLFADLPTACANALVRGGYRTRAAVAAATDDQLLRVRGLGAARLARIRALIPAGVPAPVGEPLAWALAARRRAQMVTARQEHEQVMRDAILGFLRLNGAQPRSAIRRHLTGALGSCGDLTLRGRLHRLVLAGTVEALPVVSAGGTSAESGRILFRPASSPLIGTSLVIRLCGCTPSDPRHEARAGTIVGKQLCNGTERVIVELTPGNRCLPVDWQVIREPR